MIMNRFFTVFLAAALLTLTACTGANSPQTDLNGTSWVLTQLQGQPVLDGTQPTLGFLDGQASGNGSCNGFGGEYAQNVDKLSFGALMSTLMACEPAAIMDQEQAYFSALASTVSFQESGDRLILLDAEGTVLAELKVSP